MDWSACECGIHWGVGRDERGMHTYVFVCLLACLHFSICARDSICESAFMRNKINKFRASIQSTRSKNRFNHHDDDESVISFALDSLRLVVLLPVFHISLRLRLKFIFNRVLINYLSACNLIKSLLKRATGLAQRKPWNAFEWVRTREKWFRETTADDDMNNYCSAEDNLFKANEQWIIFTVINPPRFFQHSDNATFGPVAFTSSTHQPFKIQKYKFLRGWYFTGQKSSQATTHTTSHHHLDHFTAIAFENSQFINSKWARCISILIESILLVTNCAFNEIHSQNAHTHFVALNC